MTLILFLFFVVVVDVKKIYTCKYLTGLMRKGKAHICAWRNRYLKVFIKLDHDIMNEWAVGQGKTRWT